MTSAFVGRKSESNDFASFLVSESQLGSNILILYGASGAGKTEFSRHLRTWSSKNPLKHCEECPHSKKQSTAGPNKDDVRARWVEVLKKAQARTIV